MSSGALITTPRGDAPAAPDGERREPLALLQVVHTALPIAALALGLAATTGARVSEIGAYGLIQALSPLYFVAIAIAVGSFIITWTRPHVNRLRLAVDAVTLVLLLQSPPAIIEPDARFATAWLHAGFADYVAHTGRVLPQLDARFSWPGFFAGIGALARASGLPSTIVLLKWWPVVLNLLYLPPLYFLSRSVTGSDRGAALATWLFPLVNWVGQDYFSPQSIAFLLYLILIWLVVECFPKRRARLLPGRVVSECAEPPSAATRGQQLVALAAVTTLGTATVVSHQITPIVAGLAVTLLAFFGRTRLNVFGPFLLLITAGWICYGAVAFWSGHFGLLVGGIGKVTGNVTLDLSKRLRGSPQHYRILDVRLLMTVLVWGCALAGAVVGRLRMVDVRATAILLMTPFLVLAGGGYGGEAGLRVYLFSLAGALPLITVLLSAASVRRSAVAVACLALVLVPGFCLARWGNELSEMTRPTEIAGVRALYRIAPSGATLISITPQVSWRFTAINRYRYEPDNLDEFAFDRVGAIVRRVQGNPRGAYVLITTSQLVYGEQAYGLPPDWGTELERALIRSGRFALVYSNPDTKIYQVRGDDGHA